MKKILTSLLILPILFTAACGSNNHDANATPAEYFNYTIIEQQKYVVIDGYIGPEKECCDTTENQKIFRSDQ